MLMTSNDGVRHAENNDGLFNGHYRQNPNIHTLQLKSHKASANTMPNAKIKPIISTIKSYHLLIYEVSSKLLPKS